MKRFDLKQLLLCIATLVSSQFELAGSLPADSGDFYDWILKWRQPQSAVLCTMEG